MRHIAIGLALLSTAAAADYVADVAGMATASLGQVRDPRASILRSDASGCPAIGQACRSGSYLIAGDPVLVGERIGAFVQVRFADQRGRPTEGMLPVSNVSRADPVKFAAGWAGHWVRTEATIDIKPAGGSGFAINGDATWGASDPERVRRGGVNVGEFEGALRSRGTGVVAITGTGEDPDACRVWVRLLGPYLLVTDNHACGGNNVSFSGLYRRAG